MLVAYWLDALLEVVGSNPRGSMKKKIVCTMVVDTKKALTPAHAKASIITFKFPMLSFHSRANVSGLKSVIIT